MDRLSQAERYLLDQVRGGDAGAWSQLVVRYQGRLMAFARSRLPNAADAEDLVQETFLGFLRHLPNYRELAALETLLFTILRHKIVDFYRGGRSNVCLLRDVLHGEDERRGRSPTDRFAAPEATASWYARRDEQHELRRRALSAALRELIGHLKDTLDFRDLKIAEMLFYAQLRNKDVAAAAGVGEDHVARVKHRWLQQVRKRIRAELRPARGDSAADLEGHAGGELITEVWEDLRLSCPKRSTVGAYLLGTLEAGWHEYVDFHLEKLGCRFCRANLEDLRRQTAHHPDPAVQDRILKSTVGFLKKP